MPLETGYLAPEGFEEELAQELQGITSRHGRLFFAEGGPQNVHWVQNIWLNPQTLSFQSISEAASLLRALGPLWTHYSPSPLRRSELIREKLPFFSPKPLAFPTLPPNAPIGSWTLLDPSTLIASPKCSSPFPNGEPSFLETKEPPSRAYLKLWEILTYLRKMPKRGERCLEIGASPGGWTWGLAQLGAEVIAVDRAPLAPNVCRSNISFLKQDAFSLKPSDLPPLDWVFSDVICYPGKLLEWIQPWLEKNVSLICTLKFQGEEGYPFIEAFQKIEGSGLIHLFHNKHELTWYRLRSFA